MPTLPTLSVVTISRDHARFLDECVKSVCDQRSDGIEHIVVDSGSKDGSQDLLRAYVDRGQIDKLILDACAGPADGLNQGFTAASGELFGYLNSADRLAEGACEYVRHFFAKRPDVDVLCGSIRIFDEAGPTSIRGRTASRVDVRRYESGPRTVGQQLTFFRRSAFERAGRFNANNRIAWDGEFLADLALSGARFFTTRKVFAEFRAFGSGVEKSASPSYMKRLVAYYDSLHEKLVKNGVRPYSPLAKKLLRFAYKTNALREAGYLLARWSPAKSS
jgi:glycosyltransferase involved in cell wall biosynthesis